MMKRTTIECEKCKKDVSRSNIGKHLTSCKGPAPKKKIRGIDFDPNSGFKNGTRSAWNKGLTKETNQAIKEHSEQLSLRYHNGELKLSGVATWTSEQCRTNAIKQNFGGYRENAGRSKREYRNDSNGNSVLLQSSYETKLADLLDSLDIKWIRPPALNYYDGEKMRRYYPDFLVENVVYIDTKNPFLAKKDSEKIRLVETMNNIKIEILSLELITEEHIRNILP